MIRLAKIAAQGAKRNLAGANKFWTSSTERHTAHAAQIHGRPLGVVVTSVGPHKDVRSLSCGRQYFMRRTKRFCMVQCSMDLLNWFRGRRAHLRRSGHNVVA